MNIFISYKYSGIELKKLHEYIDPIMDILKKDHKPYCNLYDDAYYIKNKYTPSEIMKHVFTKLDRCEYLIILIDGIEGGCMNMEFGYAYNMGIPKLLIIKKNMDDIDVLKGLSDNVIEYNDYDDLHNKLKKFKLKKSK